MARQEAEAHVAVHGLPRNSREDGMKHFDKPKKPSLFNAIRRIGVLESWRLSTDDAMAGTDRKFEWAAMAIMLALAMAGGCLFLIVMGHAGP